MIGSFATVTSTTQVERKIYSAMALRHEDKMVTVEEWLLENSHMTFCSILVIRQLTITKLPYGLKPYA